MSKGVNALEMIFTLFILVVVVLVVVRIFVTRMNLVEIEKPVQDITDTYNYKVAESTCKNLCSEYESDCSNNHAAVRFCLQQVKIDIDGNKIPGEKYHFNVVEGIPMCEDGIYCFHVKTNCICGSQRLDAKTCLSLLCDYYQNTEGLNSTISMSLVKNGINPGYCTNNKNEWESRIENFKPVLVDSAEGWLGPTYWYNCAGYNSTNCNIQIPNYC